MASGEEKVALVSIALCTYNGDNFLRKQLDTLVHQTYSNIEIVVVDDCSTDTTISILADYEFTYPNFKFSKNEINLGYTKNFERAISLCRGDYIALSDQDDEWDLRKIEVLMENVGTNILIFHDSSFIDESDHKLNDETMASKINMYDGDSILPFLLFNCISGHAAMFSRTLINHMIPFDKNFYHDWWLSYVAINIGEIKFINEILVKYRQHGNNITDPLRLKTLTNKYSKTRITINLNWLKKCDEFEGNSSQKLITEAYKLFTDITNGKSRISLFLFLVKYYNLLFYIPQKPKSLLSRLNYARKISFSRHSPLSVNQ